VLRDFAAGLTGSVIDAGCGPGYAAAELAAAGLPVLGVDRSAAMIDIARRRCPQARFTVADMFVLPVPDSSVAAVCSWYSIVHTPAADLPRLFGEFRRVLTEGGRVLLAFQTSAPTLQLSSAFGYDVDLRFLRHDVEVVLGALTDAGFEPSWHHVRPQNVTAGETADQAFVVARTQPAGQVAAPSRNAPADASSMDSA
jgi:SAM-dependent methyltransferase